MKKMIMAAAVILSVGSAGAIADNSTLGSLDNDSSVTQLTELDLAAVQGSGWGWGDKCFVCTNTAIVTQLNLSFGSFDVYQNNSSYIKQRNN